MSKRLQKGGWNLNICTMKTSYPIDDITYQEIVQLLQNATAEDGVQYQLLMNEANWRNPQAHGFLVLAYDDQDELVGVINALDLFGLNTYEWSTVVSPKFRRLGVGSLLVEGFVKGLEERAATGELALTLHDYRGNAFILKHGYEYSSSEATLQAIAEECPLHGNLTIRLYEPQDRDVLVEIFNAGFDDLPEETDDLITLNTTTAGHLLWVAEIAGKVVGTVTTVQEEDGMWVTALATHPKEQRQGIGTALLNWVKTNAARKGCGRVLLDVEIDNEQALSLYKKAGFVIIRQIDYFVKA